MFIKLPKSLKVLDTNRIRLITASYEGCDRRTVKYDLGSEFQPIMIEIIVTESEDVAFIMNKLGV